MTKKTSTESGNIWIGFYSDIQEYLVYDPEMQRRRSPHVYLFRPKLDMMYKYLKADIRRKLVTADSGKKSRNAFLEYSSWKFQCGHSFINQEILGRKSAVKSTKSKAIRKNPRKLIRNWRTRKKDVGVVKRSLKDTKRLPLDRMSKCRHGVPSVFVCNICNPKKFKRDTGL